MSNCKLGGSGIFLRLIFCILVGALGLTGCGSGGSDGTESGASASAQADFTRRPDTSAPSVPTDVSAKAVSSAEIDIAWSPSTDNRRVAGYTIRRSGTRIATVTGDTSFEDTGLSPSTQYTYTVEAFDSSNNVSGQSKVASANTPGAETTPPVVSATSPSNGATSVGVNSTISVTFSEGILKSTLTTATFKLSTAGGASIAGTVSVSSNIATFTPLSNLAANTQYTATITTGVTDVAGNALAKLFTWKFTTGPVTDSTPPKVTYISPAYNVQGVPLNASLIVQFSKSMTSASLTTASFTLVKSSDGSVVSGKVSVSGAGAKFTPSANLAANTLYKATISSAVKDLAGNALGSNFIWIFTTASTTSNTPPQVISTTPSNAAKDVAINSSVSATFSEAMTNSTVTAASFRLATAGGSAVAGTVTVSGNTAEFNPTDNLIAGTQYTATITTAAKDAAGTALAGNVSWTFTTAGIVDSTRPTVSVVSPANAVTGVALNSSVSATFSEAMMSSTLTTASFTLAKTTGNVAVAGTVRTTGNSATFVPSVALAASTQYTVTISTAAKDAAGNSLSSNFTSTFTTAAANTVTSATLAWDAVADPNLSGYRVYYGTAPGVYLQQSGQGIAAGKVTTYTIQGLKSGTTYYFAVSAVNTANVESALSNEVSKVLP